MGHGIFACFCVAAAMTLGGCSVSIPLPSLLGGDDDATGSIAKLASAKAAKAKADGQIVVAPSAVANAGAEAFDARDWPVAKPVLFQALATSAGGVGLEWSNPQTGGRGTFTPLAAEFTRNARQCRAFIADFAAAPVQKSLVGLGCRDEAEQWAIELGPTAR